MKLYAAIVISALVIAAAIVLVSRWDVHTGQPIGIAWRLDRLTGELSFCQIGQPTQSTPRIAVCTKAVWFQK